MTGAEALAASIEGDRQTSIANTLRLAQQAQAVVWDILAAYGHLMDPDQVTRWRRRAALTTEVTTP